MDVVGVGDVIFNQRISRTAADDLGSLRDIIRAADAAYVNFEMVTPDLPAVASATPIALRVGASAWTIDELSWMGFNLFGLANNHGDDYGYQGLLHTVQQMEARALSFAGAGRNLQAARMPSYYDVPGGRVALLCATSSGARQSLASDGVGPIGGRPGTNPLRFKTEHRLETELFDQLRRIDEALGSAEMSRRLLRLGVFPGFDKADGDVYQFAGRRFIRSAESGILTTPEPRDIEDISRWISEARRLSDVVIVGLHSHEGAAEGWNVEEPATFIAPAARAFIDAGADIVFGHGPHRLRGIEIYKGRPIFYSLGNFILMDEAISLVDPEQYGIFGLPRNSTSADLHDWRETWPDGSPRGFNSDTAYWRSVMVKCSFTDSGCSKILLYPIDLQPSGVRLRSKGVPRLAAGDTARRVMEDLSRLSRESYETPIEIAPDGDTLVGRIKVS
jgi:poly-gamma-glutamate synthesis protein (capsule biosynthesis protein)